MANIKFHAKCDVTKKPHLRKGMVYEVFVEIKPFYFRVKWDERTPSFVVIGAEDFNHHFTPVLLEGDEFIEGVHDVSTIKRTL